MRIILILYYNSKIIRKCVIKNFIENSKFNPMNTITSYLNFRGEENIDDNMKKEITNIIILNLLILIKVQL